ncbi:MAG: hypothetical protein ABI832_19980 [bacterium]
MGFIQRELDRISAALSRNAESLGYDALYAAQQALAWVLEPTGIKPPLSMIMGTQEATEDCQHDSDPGRS